MDVRELTIGALTSSSPLLTARSGKQVIVATVNDDDSGAYSDSDSSDDLGGGLILDTNFNCVWKANVAAGLWK